MRSLFIGVDGGATKCIVRVEDQSGQLLGREIRGPANIRISVPNAWEAILSGLQAILIPHQIKLGDQQYQWHAGMGLAGCELPESYAQFMQQPHPFNTLLVTSDAHTACLGAHHGNDGAIIIAGTGVVGFEVKSGQTKKVGGFGFPHDDLGGGAYLGLEAVKLTCQSIDGRLNPSPFTQAILARFNHQISEFVTWANQANSTAFAELAPIVIDHAQSGDELAVRLMNQAAVEIERTAQALLYDDYSRPLSLVGGVSSFISPFLSQRWQSRLTPAQSPPDAGAVLFIRQQLALNAKHEVSNG